MNKVYIDSLKKLDSYVRECQFNGFDPYDALNSKKIKNIRNRWLKLIITQFFVYSPVNFRPFFGIEPDVNPKALGLFLSAYCKMYNSGLMEKDDFNTISSELVELLIKKRSTGYSGYCWGFNFDWHDLVRFAPRGTPTIVISSYIGQGFLDLYDVTKEKKYLEIAESICQFIINDLNITKLDTGICFSYTPLDKHVVHNANCLGAAFLSRVYSYNHNEELLNYSTKAFDFTLSCQRKDGSWAYRLDPETGKVRNQIDFHQGFIIDSLCDFITYGGKEDKKYLDGMLQAALFYKKNQFFIDGKAKWRLPHKYPVDIHHLAQGIISFSKVYEITKDRSYLFFAEAIADWTINNMQDSQGYFYYQKWPLLKNKILYMRWGQAWMMFAFSMLIGEMEINKKII